MRFAVPWPPQTGGRHSSCCRPGAPRATPSRRQAEALGFKIGTYPTGLLSPAAAGIKAGVAALVAGDAEAASALPPPELRAMLGYADYDAQAKRFIVGG